MVIPKAWPFEGVKKSSDPDFLFDLFMLKARSEGGVRKVSCANIGHKDSARITARKDKTSRPDFAETLGECEELCAQHYASSRARGGTSCPQDRR